MRGKPLFPETDNEKRKKSVYAARLRSAMDARAPVSRIMEQREVIEPAYLASKAAE
ncbi:MAG: hypothetical protein K0S36_2475 [Nitrosospira multiformis]|jgi:hypothetical protein|nr:hypothetical protein [Nitrosospira multiformis]